MKQLSIDDPGRLLGFAVLSRLLMSGTEMTVLGPKMQARVNRNPRDADAWLDLATMLFFTLDPGNYKQAQDFQAQALALRQLYRLPAATDRPGMRLLALYGPGDMTANTPLDCLLEDSDVQVDLLYLTPDRPAPDALPDHDAVFVAIGESDANRPLLQAAERLLEGTKAPVINRPGRIARLTRDQVARDLAAIPGVLAPAAIRVERAALQRTDQAQHSIGSMRTPLLVRPVGSHGGKGLVKIDKLDSITAYLRDNADDFFYLMPFVDYSGRDGLFRKIRLVMIRGKPYPCHLAISSRWMVHYANADMNESAANRDEESRWMNEFDMGFASRHAASLAAIDAGVGLDYYGIDCAETQDGRLLVFEIDNAMIVHALDPADLYPYKQPHMQRLFDAFRGLLRTRAAG
jgi:glutathione synthase/RimK-type ligase-like ATP-grasp enzyme